MKISDSVDVQRLIFVISIFGAKSDINFKKAKCVILS